MSTTFEASSSVVAVLPPGRDKPLKVLVYGSESQQPSAILSRRASYSRRALGEYAGFVVGWSDWLSVCGTNAVVALVIGTYSGVLFLVLAGHDAIIAVAVLFAFAVLQWRGIKWGSAAQLLTAALKISAFLVLVMVGFILGGNHHAASLA